MTELFEMNAWKKVRNTSFDTIFETIFPGKEKDEFYEQYRIRFFGDFFVFMTSLDEEKIKKLHELVKSNAK